MTLTLRLALAAAFALVSTAGCSNEPAEPAAAAAVPTSAPAPTLTSAPAPVTPSASPAEEVDSDEQGLLACKLVASATENGTLRDARVVAKISKAAARSDNASIRIAGQLLSDRYDLAKESKGSDDEVSTSLEVMTQAFDMEKTCVENGLDGS